MRAVRTVQAQRAAEPLAGIAGGGRAAPQLGGAAVEILDHARGVAGIDRHRTEFEQGAKADLAGAQRRRDMLALDDLAP